MLMLKNYLLMMLLGTIDLFLLILFVYIIASFLIPNRYVGWYRFLAELCEPPLNMARKLSQNRLVIGQIDLSPLLLVFLGIVLQRIIQWLFLSV